MQTKRLTTWVVVVLLATPFITQALTSEEKTTLLLQLTQKVLELQQQIVALGGTAVTIPSNLSIPAGEGSNSMPVADQFSACTISRTLALGTKGDDVTCLQTRLISQNLLASDSATGYFGPLTERAVKQLQQAHNLEPVGIVGPLTRTAINTSASTPTTASISMLATPSVAGAFSSSRNVNNPPSASCVLTDGTTLADGTSKLFYSASSVAYPNTCTSISQSRTCHNGVLDGSAEVYKYVSCAVMGSADPAVSGVFTPEAYGAVADNKTDSTIGIQKAIAAAIAYSSPAVVKLSAGTYRVSCTPGQGAAQQYCFDINSAKNITIQGQGSANTHFIVTTPTSGLFSLSYNKYNKTHTPSDTIHFEGFSLDYDPLPFTQGTIIAVNKQNNTVDVTLDPGMPTPDSASFAPQIYNYGKVNEYVGKIIDPKTGYLKANTPMWLTQIAATYVSGRVWRFSDLGSKKIASSAVVGDKFVQVGGRAGSDAFNAVGVNNLSFHDVVIYTSSGTGILTLENTGTYIVDNVQMRPKPGSGRLISVIGGDLPTFQNWATPIIKNSYFESSGDDAFDGASRGILVTKVLSSVQIETESGFAVRQGDHIQIVSSCGELRGEANVTSVSIDKPYGTYTLSLDTPVAGVQASGGSATCTTGGASPLATYTNDVVYNVSASSPHAQIINNTYVGPADLRIYGPGSVVQGNTFSHMVWGSVALGYNSPWREGPVPRDITVSNNTFSGSNNWPGFVYTISPKSKIRNITIKGNQFANSQNYAMYLNDVSGASITQNTIQNDANWPSTAAAPDLYIGDADGVKIDGLSITDPRAIQAGVYIGPGVAAGTAGISMQGLTTQMGSAPAVLDKRPLPASALLSTGFSATQGSNSWYYLAGKGGQYSNLIWGPAPWSSTVFLWGAQGGTYPLIANGWFGAGDQDAVAKWIVLQSGTVTITGSPLRTNLNCGDGVALSILRKSAVLWQATLDAVATSTTHAVTTSVTQGDELYFVVNKRTNNSCDTVRWNPLITYVSPLTL